MRRFDPHAGPVEAGSSAQCLVVGYDDHPASVEALRVAEALARQIGAQLDVVHVVGLADYPIDPDAADWDEMADRVLVHDRQAVEEELASSPVPYTFHAVRGEPATCLARVASERRALMIVVGASGRGLARRLLGPDVSRSLAHHQRRPVLVVPAP